MVRLFPVNRRKVESIIERHLRQGLREVGEMEAKEILEAYGFVTPKGSLATTPEQAANIADQIGYPVVLKIWSPDIMHKTDVGGVQARACNSAQEVKDAFDLMMYRIPKKVPKAKILGVLVQEMCTQRPGSDPRHEPRPALRAADDVRHGRHHGRGAEGRRPSTWRR